MHVYRCTVRNSFILARYHHQEVDTSALTVPHCDIADLVGINWVPGYYRGAIWAEEVILWLLDRVLGKQLSQVPQHRPRSDRDVLQEKLPSGVSPSH